MPIHIKKKKKTLEWNRRKLYIIPQKINDPLYVKDLLKDTVAETAFPNIPQLLKIYVLFQVLR